MAIDLCNKSPDSLAERDPGSWAAAVPSEPVLLEDLGTEQRDALNFAYRIDGPDVAWKPLLAFDDGERTYLRFPENTMSSDMPTLMVQNGNQQALVNYQVRGSYYVADRLFQRAALTSGTGTNREVVQIIAEGAR